MLRIGVDEAGRGPVIGPLVVCAIAIPDSDLSLLKENGVKDSKLLSPKLRGELASFLAKYDHAYASASAADIDDSSNLNTLEVELFAKALEQLPKGNIMLDSCDVDPIRFARRVAEISGLENIISEHKADLNHIEVAAASILAKELREKEMRRIAEEIGFEIGSGYPSDPKTKAAIPRLLSGDLPHPELRWSWKTVVDAWPGPAPQRVGGNNPQRTLF